MQPIRLTLFLIFPLFLFASCDKNELETNGSNDTTKEGDIRFEIGFASQQKAILIDGSSQTRVATDSDFTDSWENGDAIGIFAVERVANETKQLQSAGNYLHNIKLTYNSGTWSLDMGMTLYFPNGSVLDFYAYYPYDDNEGKPESLDPTAIAFEVSTNQNNTTIINSTEKSNYNLSELMTAKADECVKGETVSLQFSHVMAMVQLTIDDQFGTIKVNEDLMVNLRGVRTKSLLNLNDIDITDPGASLTLTDKDNGAESIRMHRMEQPSDNNYQTNFTFRALIPAQTWAQNESIFLISKGDTLLRSSQLTSSLTMQGGGAELFTEQLPSTLLSFIAAANKTFMMGNPDTESGRSTHESDTTRNE